MRSQKIETVTIRFVKPDLKDYFISRGFFPIKQGEYEDLEGNRKIKVDGSTITCTTEERSSVYGDPHIDLFISFIPETPILDYLLKGIYFIN